jgi:hypothetical protein
MTLVWGKAGKHRRRKSGPRSSRRLPYRPTIEILESRLTPTTFNVNTFSDTVAVNFATGQDASGHISLRSAIMAVNDSGGGSNTIVLPAGTYSLTVGGPGNNESSAASGDLDIVNNVTITGAGATSTIIDRGGTDRVFHIGTSVTVSISGVTIQHGSISTTGGGIANDGSLTLTDVTVQNNTAAWGAGISNTGTLDLVSSAVINNQATGANGQNGSATGGGGGGGGAAGLGGGIYNESAASVTITNSTLSGNSATGGAGGIGYPNNGVFSGAGGNGGGPNGGASGGGAGNFASGGGGGNGAAFSPSAGGGGGFGGGGGGGGAMTHGGTGASGGTAGDGAGAGGTGQDSAAGGGGGGGGFGGALFNNGGTVILQSATLSNNKAAGGSGGFGSFGEGPAQGSAGSGRGGGLCSIGGTIKMENTIVAGNAADQDSDLNAGVTSLGHNLIGDSSGSDGFGQTDILNTPANLTALQLSGGTTPTQVPNAGSAAIDAADNKAPSQDQRGFSRVGAPDIGAAEYIPPVLTIAGPPAVYALGGPPVAIDPAATVTDSNPSPFNNGSLTVSITAGGTSSDQLGIANQGTGAGQIEVSNGTVLYGGVAIGTVSGGIPESPPLVITLNTNATVSGVQALARDITFSTTSLSFSSRTVQFALNDGRNNISGPFAQTVTIQDSGPTVTAGPESFIAVDTLFQGSGTAQSPISGPVTVTVNYGDKTGTSGVTVASDNTFSLSHLYASEGEYQVIVTAKDAAGVQNKAQFFVHVFVAGPSAPAKLVAVPGMTVTVTSGNITASLTSQSRDGFLVVAELPPDAGASGDLLHAATGDLVVAAFDVRQLHLTNFDRATITFTVFSPTGVAPLLTVIDPVTGLPELVRTSKFATVSQQPVPIAGTNLWQVTITFDSTSTPTLLELRGTVFSFTVPPPSPPQFQQTFSIPSNLQASLNTPVGGPQFEVEFSRSGFSGGSQTVVGTTASLSTRIDVGGPGEMDNAATPTTAEVRALLFGASGGFLRTIDEPEPEPAPGAPVPVNGSGRGMAPEKVDRVFAEPPPETLHWLRDDTTNSFSAAGAESFWTDGLPQEQIDSAIWQAEDEPINVPLRLAATAVGVAAALGPGCVASGEERPSRRRRRR